MKKPQKDKHFVHAPVLEGGEEAMSKIVADNLRYPEEALKNRVEGTVSVRYTIGGNGRVVSAEVTEGIGHGCDEEAVRLVKLLRFAVKRTAGLNVYHHRTLQIHFKLPPPPPPPAEPTAAVRYEIAPSKPAAAEEKKPAAPTITYTVRL
jgi:TonB family protein